MIGRALILRTASLKPVESMVRRSRLFKPLVSRFIAGDTLDEALVSSKRVLEQGLLITLDYLGENTRSEEEARSARDTYMLMLDKIGGVRQMQGYASGLDTQTDCFKPDPLNISIKLTQCGLDQGVDFAEANYRQVLDKARESHNFVRVDMESSEYTQRTLDIICRVWKEYKNTGTVLQSCLYRTDDDVELIVDLQARVRLVKGAYLEPKAVAHPEKSKVDEAFVRQAKRLLSAGFYPAIATHDEAIIRELTRFAKEAGIPSSKFEFQMLYGIRRDLQDSLRAEGYNVRVYVPFGDKWYPYFMRRLAERPANFLFILRSLFKG